MHRDMCLHCGCSASGTIDHATPALLPLAVDAMQARAAACAFPQQTWTRFACSFLTFTHRLWYHSRFRSCSIIAGCLADTMTGIPVMTTRMT